MNTVPMHLLRGDAAPTGAQLVSASVADLAALESNPCLRGDGVHAIIPDDGNHADSTIRAWLLDGDGQPLVQPIEVSVNNKDATAVAPNGLCKVEMTLTGAPPPSPTLHN